MSRVIWTAHGGKLGQAKVVVCDVEWTASGGKLWSQGVL